MDLDRLRAELTRDEGVRLKPYEDTVGKLTIGVGRNLTDCGITAAEAQTLLDYDIERTLVDLDRELPFWRNLDPVRQRVLANMAFNLGIGRLLTFKHTLVCVETGMYQAAAEGMRGSLWHRQVGPRALRLEQMMETGSEPGGAP